MKLVKEIKILSSDNNKEHLLTAIANKCKTKTSDIVCFEIIKQGIDARKKPNIYFVYNVAVEFSKNALKKLKFLEDIYPNHNGVNGEICVNKKISNRPVVVGFGPSGMFAALKLSMCGLCPIVLEQGKCVEDREKDIQAFWSDRKLNEHSNVQFGEGGAGTFSDGKLNTTLNNEHCKTVVNELILNGAPSEIYYKNKAHIGTDNLKIVVKNIRQKIEKLGGNVVFNAKFNDFKCKDGKIYEISYTNLKNNEIVNIKTNTLVLAIGHSALNTFELLNNKKIEMRQKPFAMGVRIEHKQSLINFAQYGKTNDKNLPSADYKLVEHLPNGRSVFTFCMCPGGEIVASSSEEGTIVTNGMSEFARNKEFANSALLVNVNPEDYQSNNPLAGLYFQRKYEKLAFEIAGKNYNAPAQSLGKFLHGTKCENINKCSYKPNITLCDISKSLPNFVSESLKQAIPLMDKKIKGFAGDENLLVAVESRSSCPVQFIRDENYVCTINGLYACGEGAGYAGGIISSAVDGLKCAESVVKLFK